MNYVRIYYKLSFKYRLLLCLLNNYYLNHYAKNKINSKIVVSSPDESKLMRDYEIIFNVIKNLKIEDLITLRKFIPKHQIEIIKIFDELKKQDIDYSKIIDDIKKEYVEDNSIYYNDYCDDYEYDYDLKKNSITEDTKILFLENSYLKEVYNKHLIRNVFSTDNYSICRMRSGSNNEFLGTLTSYALKYKKINNIVRDITSINLEDDSYYCLNLYLEANDDVISYIQEDLYNARIDD